MLRINDHHVVHIQHKDCGLFNYFGSNTHTVLDMVIQLLELRQNRTIIRYGRRTAIQKLKTK